MMPLGVCRTLDSAADRLGVTLIASLCSAPAIGCRCRSRDAHMCVHAWHTSCAAPGGSLSLLCNVVARVTRACVCMHGERAAQRQAGEGSLLCTRPASGSTAHEASLQFCTPSEPGSSFRATGDMCGVRSKHMQVIAGSVCVEEGDAETCRKQTHTQLRFQKLATGDHQGVTT